MWHEIVEYWTATRTPVQSWSQLGVYALFCGGSFAGGWWARKALRK